jgi:F0F1-type ATP synthase membrane subunit c/vacuolar-type H+-ATPase subunit K
MENFVLVGGNQIGGINMQSKGIIAKGDSQGNLLWNHTYNNPPNVGFWFLSVAQTGDGGYIVSGYSSALFKTDASGELEWYFSSSNDISDVLGTTNSVTATQDGGFAVVGGKSNSVWLAKFGPTSATPPAETPSPFSTTLLISAVIVEAIVIAGLVVLIYLIKRK